MVTTIYKKLMMLMLTLLVSAASFASVEIDGICYELNEWSKNAGVTAKAVKYSGSITIPSTIIYNDVTYDVTYIGQEAFSDCPDLTSVTIPNSVESIGWNAFGCCYGLTSITIPNSVRDIGNAAFLCCDGLTSVTLGNSVENIGDNAFFCCSNLTSINIPELVTSIGDQAFQSCYRITSINIPRSVTKIGDDAFNICSGLISISVEKGNTVYDCRDNCNAIIETNSNKLIAGCKNTVIPNSVTEIGQGAFCYCIEMKSIVIPNSVTTIGRHAFSGCTKLESIVIPNSVTTIESYAFSGCSNLKSVTIGKNVTSIGTNAFGWQGNQGCSALASVTILAKIPPAKDSSIDYVKAFTTYETLHVLPGCKAAYEAADEWNRFTIVEDAVDLAMETTGISNVITDKILKDGKYVVDGKIIIVKNGRKYNLNAVSE